MYPKNNHPLPYLVPSAVVATQLSGHVIACDAALDKHKQRERWKKINDIDLFVEKSTTGEGVDGDSIDTTQKIWLHE